MAGNLFKKISDFFYSVPRILFINFYKLFTRTKIFNKKRIPSDRPAIFAINHSADADPLILLAATRKKIFFLAESGKFGNWISNFFMRKLANCIPIFKNQFFNNIKSFKELLSIPKGKNVFFGIFPEGELNKKNKLKRFKRGAAYFSYKTKIPIIPVYMHNMNKAPDSKKWIWTNRISRGIISLVRNSFRKIHIFIGKPIYPIAKSIKEDFKKLAKPENLKDILSDINEALEDEFFSLKSEADNLFGFSNEEYTSGTNMVDGSPEDNLTETTKKLNT
ncbi:MAG: lysophospholipid acyltransferase family protein [Actinomycetota bacterium]|nr:lysophospholipid acyltransferase family protein [Actinomycetota bacterium]